MEVFENYHRTTPTICRFTDVKRLHYVTRAIHTHDAVEFVYVVSGEATHTVFSPDGKRLSNSRIKKGNYYIIDPGVLHSYNDGSDDFIVINILIHQLELCNTIPETDSFSTVLKAMFVTDNCVVKIPLNVELFDSDYSVYPLFEKCIKWKSENRDGLNLFIRAAVLEILCKINSGVTDNVKINLAEEIREYIDINFATDISLLKISEKFNYSIPYICRVFKKRFGISYNDYLRKVRMTNACDLLIETDYTIEKISEIFCYSSAASFRRAFTEYFRISPGQFRSQRKKLPLLTPQD